MAVTHELIAVTGEYKTKDGQSKTRFQKVGVAMENKKGGTSLLIESLPINFDGWIHMRLPMEKDGNASKGKGQEVTFDDIESDIPFS
jgi:hypothetical protein